MRASIPSPNQHKLLRRGNILNGYITYKIYLCNLIHPRAGKSYLNQRVSKSHQACHVHCYSSSNYRARDTPSLSSASMIKYMYDYDNQWKIHTTTKLLNIYTKLTTFLNYASESNFQQSNFEQEFPEHTDKIFLARVGVCFDRQRLEL